MSYKRTENSENRKIFHEQNEKFNKETEIINKTQILELKNTMNVIKSINSKLNKGETMCKFEDRSFEIL